MHTALLCFLLAIGIADIILSRGVSIAPMALLYVALKFQADRAAANLLRHPLQLVPGLRPEPKDEPSWMPSPERDPFPPLRLVTPTGESQEKAQETRAKPTKPAAEAGAKARGQARKPPSLPRPNFHGRPHEVLAVGPEAHTATIKQAFRRWIKEFHPDQSGAPPALATERARKLTTAKETLLLTRKRQSAA